MPFVSSVKFFWYKNCSKPIFITAYPINKKGTHTSKAIISPLIDELLLFFSCDLKFPFLFSLLILRFLILYMRFCCEMLGRSIFVRTTLQIAFLPIIPQSALLFNPIYEKTGATLSESHPLQYRQIKARSYRRNQS